MNQTVITLIQDYNPSYNPKEEARIKAGIDAETLKNAEDRVYSDGYYGPFSPAIWEEEDGRYPYSVPDALKILAKVADNVEDYWDKDDDEFGFDFNNAVDSADIIKAMWPFLTEIYGSIPW